jgi:hypothetical protein
MKDKKININEYTNKINKIFGIINKIINKTESLELVKLVKNNLYK